MALGRHAPTDQHVGSKLGNLLEGLCVGGGVKIGGRALTCSRGLAVAIALVMVVTGCASSQNNPRKGSRGGSTTATSTAASPPTLAVSPDRNLVAGEQLQVNVAGFRADSALVVYECASVPPPSTPFGCGPSGPLGGTITLFTDSSGRASGVFAASPMASTGQGSGMVACRDQCVVVATLAKVGPGEPPDSTPTASASLSFSTTATPSPADWSLDDLSWVSASDGWALGGLPCAAGLCAEVAQTEDGGANWQPVGEPSAVLASDAPNCSSTVCVSSLRFANANDGYLFGPALLMTVDGGRGWQVQPGPQIETLAVVDGGVFRIAYNTTGCPGPCDPSLQEAFAGSTTWRTLINVLDTPGRSDSAQIVNSGSTVIVATYGDLAGPVSAQAVVYLSTDGGHSWQQEADPCSGKGIPGEEVDLVTLAAAPGGFFAGACLPHLTATGGFLVVSTDGGKNWHRAAALPAKGFPTLTAASATNLALSNNVATSATSLKAMIWISTDQGQRWSTAATETIPQPEPYMSPQWLGFETPQVGRWIADPHNIWTTTDGGLHWREAAFR